MYFIHCSLNHFDMFTLKMALLTLCYSIIHLFLQVIYVQAFVLVILFGKLVRKIFFGQLRAAEFEVS